MGAGDNFRLIILFFHFTKKIFNYNRILIMVVAVNFDNDGIKTFFQLSLVEKKMDSFVVQSPRIQFQMETL